MTYGQRLQRIRRHAGLTQEQLGQALSPPLQQHQISRREVGQTDISIDELVQMLRACRTTTHAFFGEGSGEELQHPRPAALAS